MRHCHSLPKRQQMITGGGVLCCKDEGQVQPQRWAESEEAKVLTEVQRPSSRNGESSKWNQGMHERDQAPPSSYQVRFAFKVMIRSMTVRTLRVRCSDLQVLQSNRALQNRWMLADEQNRQVQLELARHAPERLAALKLHWEVSTAPHTPSLLREERATCRSTYKNYGRLQTCVDDEHGGGASKVQAKCAITFRPLASLTLSFKFRNDRSLSGQS